MYGENFCLKWNDFESNIRNSFKELRENNNYLDVTLACEDGHQIEAHKIVLSAGSTFFSNIFRKSKHPNPFLYLKGIQKDELEHIIDFLYNGETYVPQEGLDKFLDSSQKLRIKGLQRNQYGHQYSNLQESKPPEPKLYNSFQRVENHKTTAAEDVDDNYYREDNYDTKEVALIRSDENNFVANTVNELDLQIEQMIIRNRGVWECKVCGKACIKKQDIQRHAEGHIEGISHICHICNKSSSTRKALQVHINYYHSQLLDCNICGKIGMTKVVYKQHISTCRI